MLTPDLAWQLQALGSIGAGVVLGIVIRRGISRMDERRRDR